MASLTKFASEGEKKANRFGIKNSKGDLVTMEYLRRYIHCWCRVEDGFDCPSRKSIIAHFMSDAMLEKMRGRTASDVGHAAALSTMWEEAGAKPIRSKSDQEEMKRLAQGIKTVNPKTTTGRMELEEIARKAEEAKVNAAKQKRMDAIRTTDPDKIKRLLKMDVSSFPDDIRLAVEQFRADYAEFVAETKVVGK